MKVQRARNRTAIGGDELVAQPVGGGDEGGGDGEGEEVERLPWGGWSASETRVLWGRGLAVY